MKQDKKLHKLNQMSYYLDRRSLRLDIEHQDLNNRTFCIDRTYFYWGPSMSSDQALKYIKRKKIF